MNTLRIAIWLLGMFPGLVWGQASPAAASSAPLVTKAAPAVETKVKHLVRDALPGLVESYHHFHRNPELSFQEVKTAARMASALRQAGLTVTEGIGGHGVVAFHRNGEGPTLLVRADMDALPVREQTGLPYASTAKALDDQGNEVDVMHACGHDVHMTCLLGTARVMMSLQDEWKGTLLLIAQPAEERGAGALAMLRDGLFTRFPVPDYALALHVSDDHPAGTVTFVPGYAMANVDSVDILIRGVAGHGAYPHAAKDPIVLAAQTILALQTIVSREISPTDPAVVTVGSIHGGTKHNIIPSEVLLQLTLRSYSDEVRAQMIASLRRITTGLAEAAGLSPDLMPVVTVKDEYTPASYHDPELTLRVAGVFRGWFGAERVIAEKPVMGGEDFGRYGRTDHKVPIFMFGLGSVPPELHEASLAGGPPLPPIHSPFFAPAPEKTVETGVTAMVAALLDLFGSP